MASQFLYTSVARGPTGHPGFQFVARSPGADKVDEDQIRPLMRYEAPASTPPRLSRAEIGLLPVAFGFTAVSGGLVLSQCRYSGQDYSHRDGNFIGHAVHMQAPELTQYRPIEFIDANFWGEFTNELPAALPTLPGVAPGTSVSVESVMSHMARASLVEKRSYASLLAHVLLRLSGSGRVFLMAEDEETRSQIIGFLSFSLPQSCVKEMTFVTYSGNPGSAINVVVGVLPDTFLDPRPDDLVARFDEELAPPPSSVMTYAAAITTAWFDRDLQTVDALLALANALIAAPAQHTTGSQDKENDTWEAVTQIALAARGEPVPPGPRELAGELLEQNANLISSWIWRAFASGACNDLEMNYAVWRAASHLGTPEVTNAVGLACVRIHLSPEGRRFPPQPPGIFDGDAAQQAVNLFCEAVESAESLNELVRITMLLACMRLKVPQSLLTHKVVKFVSEQQRIDSLIEMIPVEFGTDFKLGVTNSAENAPSTLRRLILSDMVLRWLHPIDLRTFPMTALIGLIHDAENEPKHRIQNTSLIFGMKAAGNLSLEDFISAMRRIWPLVPGLEDRCRVNELVYALAGHLDALLYVIQNLTVTNDLMANSPRTEDERRLLDTAWRYLGLAPSHPVRLEIGLNLLRGRGRLLFSAGDIELLLKASSWRENDWLHVYHWIAGLTVPEIAEWLVQAYPQAPSIGHWFVSEYIDNNQSSFEQMVDLYDLRIALLTRHQSDRLLNDYWDRQPTEAKIQIMALSNARLQPPRGKIKRFRDRLRFWQQPYAGR